MLDRAINVIPTGCPKFLAACATCGIELEKGTPGVSNTYSKGVTYDPDEPGQIHYYLDYKNVNPLAVAAVWRNPSETLTEVAALKQRLIKCKDADTWQKIADDIHCLHLNSAIAHISLFCQNKFAIDTEKASDHEHACAKVLSDCADYMRTSKTRNGAQVAAQLEAAWTPAMFAWIKAFIANYREIKDLWRSAKPSIKIDRGDFFPLIIPKGKNFTKLLKRWT